MVRRKNAFLAAALSVLAVCGWASGSGEADKGGGKKVTLTWAFLESNNTIVEHIMAMAKEYEALNPNVSVKVESFKDTPSYNQAMQIRLAAKQLPDIMFLKGPLHQMYKDEMVPLNGEPYIARNKFAKGYAIDGNYYFIPAVYIPEAVFYRKSVFKELGLKIPTTWPEYVEMLRVIKKDGKYIPYAMGGKDEWPVYPLSEVGPALLSGDNDYYNTIAKQDEPFGKGTSFYRTAQMIYQLAQEGVLGPDPVGTGWDQAAKLFESKQAATINAGFWYISGYAANVGNYDDLGAFPLPLRDSVDQPLRVMHWVDHFYGVTKSSKNIPEAKKMLAWFFSKDVNQKYVDVAQMGSAFGDVQANISVLKELTGNYKFDPYFVNPQGELHSKLADAVQLNWYRFGQELLVPNLTTPDKISADYNAKWKKARASNK